MSDIAAAFMSALGMGPKKEKPVLSAAEEAAPWLVPQGGAGGTVPQGGSAGASPTLPEAAPTERLDEIDALLQEIKKQKQRAAILGGSPAPQ